jgi:hypothetical protein
MVNIHFVSLFVHVNLLLNLGKIDGLKFGVRKMSRIYVATGTGYAVTQWAAELLFSRCGRPRGALNIAGPAGNLIGLTAAIVAAEQQAWSGAMSVGGTTQTHKYTMFVFGIELEGPEHLLAAQLALHLFERGVKSIPGCASAAAIGYYLGAYYATQWYLSEMAKQALEQPKLDGWLDFGLRVVSELISS